MGYLLKEEEGRKSEEGLSISVGDGSRCFIREGRLLPRFEIDNGEQAGASVEEKRVCGE